MSLLLGIVLAFMALIIGSPLIALFLGISFTLLIGSAEGLILKSIGTKLLQIGIVILGLTISSSGAITLTAKYFPYISIFVIVIFLIGFIISKVLKIDTRLSILLVSGTAICGATAMVAISPLIKAKPKDLLISLGVIFIFNAVAIAILPIIGNNIEMSSEQFGSWMALAVHDTSSVIGAAMSFGDNAVETATTLKLGRTIWLIPLILITNWIFNKRAQATKFPRFILFFILAIVANTVFAFNEQIINILQISSQTFLLIGLFCIGSQFDPNELNSISGKPLVLALMLWALVIPSAYFLVKYF